MPTARADVDREAVEAHVRQHGVRATAKDFGLPLATVGDWSRQGGWCRPQQQIVRTSQKGACSAPNGPNKPGFAAQNALARLGSRSRLNALRTVDKGFKHSSKMDGDSILAAAPSLASLGKLAQQSKAPGWEQDAPTSVRAAVVLADAGAVADVLRSIVLPALCDERPVEGRVIEDSPGC